jgi:hypothetical protein
MHLGTILWIAFCAWQPAPPAPDAAQFARIMDGCWADVKDFEFVVEGTLRYVADEDAEWSRRHDRMFQTNYAYRLSDGAAYFETYYRYTDPARLPTRQVYATFQDQLTSIGANAQTPSVQVRPTIEPGGPGYARYHGSPERFLFHWFWKKTLSDPEKAGYTFEGWEDVDGRRCIRVSFDEAKGHGFPSGPVARFWIDLERGGHALRHEFSYQGTLWLRVHDVALAPFRLPDQREVWFPVRATEDTFGKDDKFLDSPVFREEYRVVNSSVVFNQGFRDDRFTVDWNGRKASSPGLSETQRAFAKTPKKDQSPPRLRSDPAGVEEWQKQKLAEADQQARQLEASAPGGWAWNGAQLIQAALFVLGCSLLVVAIVRRIKG